jgi:thioredoxin-dependent peroxiredoxin
MPSSRKAAVKKIVAKKPTKSAKKPTPAAKPPAKAKASATAKATQAPDFTLPSLNGPVSLKKLKGKKVVLYFYPKDDTSGCTKQACGFQDNLPQFKKAGAVVIGVSKDDLNSHKKFAKKYGLNFDLASDEDLKAAKAYNAWVEKSMYGKKFMGLDRSTFLINEKGQLVQEWRKVKVPGHVKEVLGALKKI